ELGQVAPEPVGDQVLHAIAGRADALAAAPDLATAHVALLERAQVIFQSRQTEAAQRGGAIDVAQAPCGLRHRPAEDHPSLDVLGPGGQPDLTAPGALAQL